MKLGDEPYYLVNDERNGKLFEQYKSITVKEIVFKEISVRKIQKNQNVLKEYLASREKEVTTMMMDLYDQDRIMEIHIASERKIAAEEAKDAIIQRMLKKGKFSVQEIAECLAVSTDRVREIEAMMLQEA